MAAVCRRRAGEEHLTQKNIKWLAKWAVQAQDTVGTGELAMRAGVRQGEFTEEVGLEDNRDLEGKYVQRQQCLTWRD